MLNNLLAIVAGTGENAGNYYFDNFGEAAIYALIGFLVVFAGIVILIAVIWLVGLIMRKTDNLAFLTKKRNKKVTVKQDNNNTQAVADTESDEIPDEVKAAIVAAIMAYYEEKEEKCQFTVKRIKRI